VSSALDAARAALRDQPAWVVGGAIRDRLLGRQTDDVDLVVAGDVGAAARRLAGTARAAVFPLSERFGAWRVVARDRAWHADLAPLADGGIEADLSRRDFTINAMAEPVAGGEVLDPFGGRDDLAAARLRMVGPDAFADDPLRALRLVRFAVELGLAPEPATEAAARVAAPRLDEISGERVFAELKRVVVADAVLEGLARMDALGLTDVVLPELVALRGVEQGVYHHLDVLEHTREALAAVLELERDPSPFGVHAEATTALLAEPFADELTRAQALRFGALLHDVAKPLTRHVFPGGKVGFPGHDAQGAAIARDVLGRLRASEKLRAHVAALARHHLRLGFLVHEQPLSRRAIYAYLRACTPVEVDVTVLSIADRLATRGRRAEEAIAKHLELAQHLLGEALAFRAAGPPAPLVRGDDLARELGLERGPELGLVLEELEAARFAGEIATQDEAIAHARDWTRGRRYENVAGGKRPLGDL
jgi:poly(A) polymerase